MSLRGGGGDWSPGAWRATRPVHSECKEGDLIIKSRVMSPFKSIHSDPDNINRDV